MLVVLDSISLHYHKQVMQSPAQYLASTSRELVGRVERDAKIIKDMAAKHRIPVIFTAWTKSEAVDAFKKHEIQKLAKAVGQGSDIGFSEYTRLLYKDPVEWVGGGATGGFANLRLRILEDQDESRILYVQKLAAGGIIPGTGFKLQIDEKTRRIVTDGPSFILRKEAYQRLHELERRKAEDGKRGVKSKKTQEAASQDQEN